MEGQEKAILKVKEPCVVLAGAGTGKTHTIVEKIKYLIKNGIYSPEKIVCITFSNEAANNLILRVQKALILDSGKEPIIRTFHGFSADLLRKYGESLGIKKDFKILTPNDAKVMLNRYLKVSVINCHRYINSINTAKDLGISLDSIKEYAEKSISKLGGGDLEKRLEELQLKLKILYLKKNESKKDITNDIKNISSALNLKKFACTWGAYDKIKKARNYQDYSDLNNNALVLLKQDNSIISDYSYIIVDEFQDTNKVQLDLIYYLAQHKNITVVGDLNQSIYRFRGAYKKNFNDFTKMFSITEKDIFNLDKSYRSSNKILRIAHKLILNNYNEKNTCFEVLNYRQREGENVEIYELKNAREEARKIVELIKREIESKVEMKDICVLFRTHQQGRIIKNTLEFAGIPYVSVDRRSLLKEKSIRTAIDYLTILNKIKNKEKGGKQAWWDLAYHSNFSEEDLIKIGKYIKENRDSENLSALMLNSLLSLNLSESGKLSAEILIERIKKMLPEIEKDIHEVIKHIFTVGGLINKQKSKEEKAVMMNLNRFYDLAKEHSSLYFPDLSSFINYLEIIEDLGIEIEAADFEAEGVRLMTSHATKGLEYKTVIITNLAQKRFPMEKITSNPLIPLELSPEYDFNLNEKDREYAIYESEVQNQIFEERRLCYVSFTRAKNRLILTYAGEYGGKKHYPSQFLQEIKYKENKDISFYIDIEEKYQEPKMDTRGAENFSSILEKSNFNEELLSIAKEATNEKEKKAKEITFSPSALLCFAECQKKYEYLYVYNMPEPKSISWEAILMGSFVHRVLEAGVKNNLKSLKEFFDAAREMKLEDDWKEVNLEEAEHLVEVFFERNKNKYNASSKTEQVLKKSLGGIPFIGFADRIDFSKDGIEITDYKTGKSNVPPRSRNWQLGYYALAASQFGKVKKVTLDMLKHDKPIEFKIDEKGNAESINSPRMDKFNIYSIEEELIRTANEIMGAFKIGFKPCDIEKNCEFCGEWVYRI